MNMLRNLGLAAVFTCAAAAGASAATIDFESDVTGNKANGFVSSDSALVSFTDTAGSNLRLTDFGNQSDGIGLGVFGDDASKLLMTFTVNVLNLALDFGNDDPRVMPVGGLAILQGFLNGTLVGESSVVTNRDDIMNQTIGLGSAVIDEALFFYADAQGNPIALIEVVDNISFTPAGVIPLPASGLLLLGGLGGIAALRRRKKA